MVLRTTTLHQQILALLALLLVATRASGLDGGKVLRVESNGGVFDAAGNRVATTALFSSSIQRDVIDALFEPVKRADWNLASNINASTLRYLHVNANFKGDALLTLPSLFVLKLNGTLTQAANLSIVNLPLFSALVQLQNTSYSAVTGGTINATGQPLPAGPHGVQAITITHGNRNSIRSVRAVAARDSAIGINGGSGNEVTGCDVGGSPGYIAPARCIWTLATRRAFVHGNHVHHCRMHALDFDAYTSASVAASNLCEDNAEEGIFVEETANGNMIFNNTCRRNRNGIGVYSNVVGPVTDNYFFNNVVEENSDWGITAGGLGHNPKKYSLFNVFVGNRAARNGGDAEFDPMHGAVEGDFWVSNIGDFSTYPDSTLNSSIFDP